MKKRNTVLGASASTACGVLSRVQFFATPRTTACPAPLSMGFPRQEYWSGFPFPSPGDLSNPGIEPRSLTSPAKQDILDSIVESGRSLEKEMANHLSILVWKIPWTEETGRL